MSRGLPLSGEPTGMDEKETILTPEGLRKIEDELEHLKSVKRKEIAERIKQPLGTVKTRIRLGLERLREMVKAPS